jgi:hypothetical protein
MREEDQYQPEEDEVDSGEARGRGECARGRAAAAAGSPGGGLLRQRFFFLSLGSRRRIYDERRLGECGQKLLPKCRARLRAEPRAGAPHCPCSRLQRPRWRQRLNFLDPEGSSVKCTVRWQRTRFYCGSVGG